MKIAVFFTLSFFFLLSFASAVQVCDLYDDFSSGALNSSKWEESTFHGDPFTDEHFVNVTEEVYRIAQNSPGDAETNLAPKRHFIAGESFSYDIIYNGGSGNHFSQPLINGNYPPSQIESCLAPGGCGPIGFWNGVPDLQAQIGVYKINFSFSPNEVKMIAIRPDNVTIINTFTGNSEPYNITINTHTGHNGLMHFDYDNVVICSEQSVPPGPSVEERLTDLEQKVSELENRTSTLEEENTELRNDVNFLESLINKIIDFIRNLPKGLSKNWRINF